MSEREIPSETKLIRYIHGQVFVGPWKCGPVAQRRLCAWLVRAPNLSKSQADALPHPFSPQSHVLPLLQTMGSWLVCTNWFSIIIRDQRPSVRRLATLLDTFRFHRKGLFGLMDLETPVHGQLGTWWPGRHVLGEQATYVIIREHRGEGVPQNTCRAHIQYLKKTPGRPHFLKEPHCAAGLWHMGSTPMLNTCPGTRCLRGIEKKYYKQLLSA